MRISARARRSAAVALAALAVSVASAIVLAPAASAAPCSDLDVVFARGSGEFPGLGSAGTPLVNEIKRRLPGVNVSSYAVNYGAALDQSTAGAGATDMTNHVVSQASMCPNQKFVLGGYSQGGSVTDIAIGIPTTLGQGRTIPADLAPRVTAVVAFGNPLGLSRRTIKQASPTYGARSWEACNNGDPVCGGVIQHPGGFGHLAYPMDGAPGRAADFVAQQYRGTSA